jgi:integrase
MLRKLIGDRNAGFVFCTPSGSPLRQSNISRRDLHPTLESLGLSKTGFHMFRRFRITYLRKQRTSEDLIQYWVGHANKSVTDGYSKIKDNREYRRQVCEQVGLVFDLPELYEITQTAFQKQMSKLL